MASGGGEMEAGFRVPKEELIVKDARHTWAQGQWFAPCQRCLQGHRGLFSIGEQV